MPIRLKGVLLRAGLTQSDWAASIAQSDGQPLSKSSASLLINWGRWPRRTPQEWIRNQTEIWLRAQGVPPAEIDGCWDIDADDPFRGRAAAGLHLTQANAYLAGARARPATPEPEFEPLEPTMLSPAAKRHFKLFRDPFQDEIGAADDVYLGDDQRYIGEAMMQTAKHGGFVAVVGESGSGKSTLRKMLVERLRDQPVRVIFPQTLDKTKLTTASICAAIVRDLAPDARVRDKHEAMARQVREVLLASSGAGFGHVLVIEEAHDLTIATLKYLKRFYELEDGFKKLLGIILIAQPEMKHKLNERMHPEAREVIRRIEVAELLPLGQQLEGYLAHKLRRVNADAAAVFDADAYDALRARWSKRDASGQPVSHLYPLIVNNTVTRCMNRAAELGAPKVNAELVREV